MDTEPNLPNRPNGELHHKTDKNSSILLHHRLLRPLRQRLPPKDKNNPAVAHHQAHRSLSQLLIVVRRLLSSTGQMK